MKSRLRNIKPKNKINDYRKKNYFHYQASLKETMYSYSLLSVNINISLSSATCPRNFCKHKSKYPPKITQFQFPDHKL